MVRELLAAAFLAFALVPAISVRAEPSFPDTTLPLRLVGTVVASSAERSIAVIENDGARAVVRRGDEIRGARVSEIRKDAIVLDQSGRLEQLLFASAPVASSGQSRTVAAASATHEEDVRESESARRDWRRAANERRARAAAKANATRASAVPASAARDTDDEDESGERSVPLDSQALLAQLANQARYAPYHDDEGKLRGVALMDVRPDSTLERLGLRSGDVVLSIAGVKVDNTTKAFDALRSINPRAGGEVLVERRGVPTRIAVPPGAL